LKDASVLAATAATRGSPISKEEENHFVACKTKDTFGQNIFSIDPFLGTEDEEKAFPV
jgi:hypothetical protein